MTHDTKKPLRLRSLIIVVCVFLVIVRVSATPQRETKERADPVRRFFVWMTKTVSRPFRKRVPPISAPPIVFITSSTSTIYFCPLWMHSLDNCSARREVELSASAGGPDVDGKLVYVWAVSAGRIRCEGQKVIWELSDAADGTYTANVEVTDRTGLTANASTNVTIALCHSCVTSVLPCPTIMVNCPDNAESGKSMTFKADVYGGDPTVKVTYTWSVSAGKISAGQGTSMITVDVSDVTRGSITAKVSIGGPDPACVNTASCTTRTAGGVAKAGCQPF